MQITRLAVADVYSIKPKRFRDGCRCGYFCETYRRDILAEAEIKLEFVQDDGAPSVSAESIRDLHYQARSYVWAKLVRVLAGEVASDRDVSLPRLTHISSPFEYGSIH